MNRQKKEELKRTQHQQGDHSHDNQQQGSARQHAQQFGQRAQQQGDHPPEQQEAFEPRDTD